MSTSKTTGSKKAVTWIVGVILFVVLLYLDRFSKQMAVLHLKDQPPYELIPNVFILQYLENHGAAFGILQGQRGFFLLITVIILLIIVILYIRIPYTKRFLPLRFLAVLIVTGAIGNFIDRFQQGYVVDFFYFCLINFPIFNVADIYVTGAAIALVVFLIFIYKEEDLTELGNALKPGKKKNSNQNG